MPTLQNAREYRFYDKSSWGEGEWQNEVDKMQWDDPLTNLPCLAVRNSLGAWCGYVGVSEDHPWHGVGKDVCILGCGQEDYCSHKPRLLLRAHGGVNYAAACDGNEEYGVCHVPEPGQPEAVWWFGFDCARGRDYCPGMDSFVGRPLVRGVLRDELGTYRNLAYVQDQCAGLASQLEGLGRGGLRDNA